MSCGLVTPTRVALSAAPVQPFLWTAPKRPSSPILPATRGDAHGREDLESRSSGSATLAFTNNGDDAWSTTSQDERADASAPLPGSYLDTGVTSTLELSVPVSGRISPVESPSLAAADGIDDDGGDTFPGGMPGHPQRDPHAASSGEPVYLPDLAFPHEDWGQTSSSAPPPRSPPQNQPHHQPQALYTIQLQFQQPQGPTEKQHPQQPQQQNQRSRHQHRKTQLRVFPPAPSLSGNISTSPLRVSPPARLKGAAAADIAISRSTYYIPPTSTSSPPTPAAAVTITTSTAVPQRPISPFASLAWDSPPLVVPAPPPPPREGGRFLSHSLSMGTANPNAALRPTRSQVLRSPGSGESLGMRPPAFPDFVVPSPMFSAATAHPQAPARGPLAVRLKTTSALNLRSHPGLLSQEISSLRQQPWSGAPRPWGGRPSSSGGVRHSRAGAGGSSTSGSVSASASGSGGVGGAAATPQFTLACVAIKAPMSPPQQSPDRTEGGYTRGGGNRGARGSGGGSSGSGGVRSTSNSAPPSQQIAQIQTSPPPPQAPPLLLPPAAPSSPVRPSSPIQQQQPQPLPDVLPPRSPSPPAGPEPIPCISDSALPLPASPSSLSDTEPVPSATSVEPPLSAPPAPPLPPARPPASTPSLRTQTRTQTPPPSPQPSSIARTSSAASSLPSGAPTPSASTALVASGSSLAPSRRQSAGAATTAGPPRGPPAMPLPSRSPSQSDGDGGGQGSLGGSTTTTASVMPPAAASTGPESPGGDGDEGGAMIALAEVPTAPEVVVRPPRWLKPAAFQVTEQLRTGRLQELADRLAAVTCPTFFDLGGLEFSGALTPPAGGAAAASFAELSGIHLGPDGGFFPSGSVGPATRAHRTLRAGLHGIGFVGADRRVGRSYHRDRPVSAGVQQPLVVPPGQHITLYNATLLLTAEQYILVGRGASLTLKGVEVLGCSREAARASAAARRRAVAAATTAAVAAAAIAAAAAASAQQHTTAPPTSAHSGPGTPPATLPIASASMPLAASGSGSRISRRASSPGRTDPSGTASSAAALRRFSVTGGAADGGLGLPPVRRRRPSVGAATASTGTSASGGFPVGPVGLASAGLPGLGGPGTSGGLSTAEMVDPTEYVEEHGLIEVVGGFLRVSNSRIWPGRCQMALCVSAGGSANLSYCTVGACCAAGGKSGLASEHTMYDAGPGSGCCVSALYGGRVGLSSCTLRYGDAGGSGSLSGEGALGGAQGAGGASSEALGLEARGGGTLAVLLDCELQRCGISAACGACVHLHNIAVHESPLYGLSAADPGTALYGKDCRVDDCGSSAAAVAGGATLRLADSHLAGSVAGPGLLVVPFSTTGAPPEAECTTGSSPPPLPRTSAALLRCEVTANAGHGAMVAGAGGLALFDTVLYNNLFCGVSAEGVGATLTCVGVRVIRNEAHGFRAADGASAVLTRCCASSNGRDGVEVEGVGSRAVLTRCESRENRESGLCVTGSANVELSFSRLTANQHDGLAVGGDGSLAIAHGCVLNGNVAKGAAVCMGGAAELTECAVHCNGSKSAQVSDTESQLLLGRCCCLDRPAVAVSGGNLMNP